jgi:hypothetical protein
LPRRRAPAATAIAKEILGYFLRRPHAADTLEGIARWRLLDERIHRRVDEIDQALAWLVEEGFLFQESAPGSQPIFSLNDAKAAEADDFLTGHHRAAGRGKSATR